MLLNLLFILAVKYVNVSRNYKNWYDSTLIVCLVRFLFVTYFFLRMVWIYRRKLASILKVKTQRCQYQNPRFYQIKLVPQLFDNFWSNTILSMIRTIDNHYLRHIMRMQHFHLHQRTQQIRNISKKCINIGSKSISLNTFSLSLSLSRLIKYLPYNRNLNRIRDLDLKMQLLKVGRLSVVSFLSELPKTEHDLQSFAVDLTLFTVSYWLQRTNILFHF